MKQVKFSLFVLVISIFHFKILLGRQVMMSITPCDFVNHGSHLYKMYPHYKELYPDLPQSSPLSRGEDFPMEYYLHYSVPQKHKSVFHEMASEWNREVMFEAFNIKHEIDYSEMDSNQGISDSKNVIYWFNEDQYDTEFVSSKSGALNLIGAKIFIKPNPIPSHISIAEADINLYEKEVTVIGRVHTMFTLHLQSIGIDPPKEMDGLGLQRLFVEHLSSMNQDDFYNMILQYRLDKGFKPLPNASRQDIQNAILQDINTDMPDVGPVNSFEDLHDLLIREYSFDITKILDDTTLLENYVRHEFGHAFGLGHHKFKDRLMEDVLLDRTILLPRHFIVPNAIDELVHFGLSCAYDLDYLMRTKPL